MYRLLLAATLLVAAPAMAQSTPDRRPMPSYQDNDAQWRGGTSESYGTADLHHHVDQTAPPPPVPDGYGAYDEPPAESGGQAPRSDPGSPNDTAHWADRARQHHQAEQAGYAGRATQPRAGTGACQPGTPPTVPPHDSAPG